MPSHDSDPAHPDASASRVERALAALPRLAAPAELEGRVVAALNDGVRGERAAARVEGLSAVRAPDVLDRLVAEHVDPLRAPTVLARLVDERVREPEAGVTRAMLGRLERLAAPDELAARLGAPGGLVPRRAARVLPRLQGLGGVLGVGLAAAALLLVVAPGLGGGGEAPPRDVFERAPLARSFEFVGHATPADAPFDPGARRLLGSLVGEPLEGAL